MSTQYISDNDKLLPMDEGEKAEHSRLVGGSFFLFVFCLFVFVLLFFRAAPTVYGSSQARGQIRATAAGLHTATATHALNCVCNLHHSSWQSWIPDPTREARDQTCILMDTSQIHSHCATTGTPRLFF